MGPAPMTSAVEPCRGAMTSTACAAHDVGSVNTAVSSSSPSTEKTCTAGATRYSANPPGRLDPTPVRSSHSSGRPSRQ